MKKILALIMAMAMLLCTCLLPVHGEDAPAFVVNFHFNTVQKGTPIDRLTDTVDVSPDCFYADPDSINVHTFAGHPYTGELLPGHTYYFESDFLPNPDAGIPLFFNGDNILRTAGPFVKAMWSGCYYDISYTYVQSIHFIARFTVPGTPWQMITGRVVDWFGKLRSNFGF